MEDGLTGLDGKSEFVGEVQSPFQPSPSAPPTNPRVIYILSLFCKIHLCSSATSTTHSEMLVNKRLNANPSLILKIQQTKPKLNGSMHLKQWIGWRAMIMAVVMGRERVLIYFSMIKKISQFFFFSVAYVKLSFYMHLIWSKLVKIKNYENEIVSWSCAGAAQDT